MIKAIEDKEKKINDYKVYTNTYTNFDWFQLSHLFELYNWYFIENCDKLEYILIDLANILFSLYKRTNQININENKKSDELIQIIEIISSFGDILSDLIEIIPKLFTLIISISNKHLIIIDNIIVFKILCIYCLFLF